MTFWQADTKPVVGGLGLLLFGVAAFVSAHDTWLGPVSKPVLPGSVILLDLSSGRGFPSLESPIDPSRVARADHRLQGKSVPLKTVGRTKKSLRFSAALGQVGIATIAVALRPNRIELTPSQVDEYLAEIGALATAGSIWHSMPDPKKWRETYTKSAKTYVRVGDAITDFGWTEPLGLALEIVPQLDPTILSVGDSLPVVVLKNGVPLADFSLEADPGSEGKALRALTDSEGRATFIFAAAGPWLLKGTDLRFQPTTQDWQSDFTTLTVIVTATRVLHPEEHGTWPPKH